MHSELAVWFEQKLVGNIRRSGRGRSGRTDIIFQYAPAWLEDKGTFPISLSLPFQSLPFGKEVSSNFFDNLLPEETVRKHVADANRLPVEDIFGLLQAIGADCAGALSILNPGEQPCPQEYAYKLIPPEALPEFLARQRTAPLGIGKNSVRLSLAGAQSKVSLLLSNDTPPQYKLPLGGAPGTHIVKPASLSDIPFLAENEAFCSILAKALGFETPETGLTPTMERGFVSRRYDRQQIPGRPIRRLHQEDFCQALGMPRTKKYQKHGGIGYKDCFAILDGCHNPEEDRWKLFRWAVFNYLIGNADAHAKNISLLYDKLPKPRLAPFYDLVCTAVYSQLDDAMAMKIGRKSAPNNLYDGDWKKFIALAGVPQTEAIAEMARLCVGLSILADGAGEKFLAVYGQIPLIPQIAAIIKKRVAYLRASMKLPS